MAAQTDYLEMYQIVESQLSQIRALLNGHCKEVEPNYGHVGDLELLSQQLRESIEFMGGDIFAAAPNKFWANTGNGYKMMVIPE